MSIYKVRVLGDTYEEYDGDVLVETSEKIKALNRDITLEYSGPFNMLKILEPFLDKSVEGQMVAYKTAHMKKAASFMYIDGEFIETKFDCVISNAVDKIHDRTITAKNSELIMMTHKSSKDGWNATSTEEELMWNISDGKPQVTSIQNSVTVFENGDDREIIIMLCGSVIRKKLVGPV